MATPLFANEFFHDGRGPELRRVHWAHDGRVLLAVDYLNPDHAGDDDLRHVRFERVQVVMITPEEVINYGTLDLGDRLVRYRPAAMFDLGRSSWVSSFSPRHLASSRHLQLVFYDELLEVICEGVTCHSGKYT